MNPPIVDAKAPVTLVAGGPLRRAELRAALARAPHLVAADGGADRALALGVEPVAVIGDLDSLSDAARLRLAQRLERGAANAYLGVIPAFGSKDLAQVAGKLASDETAHWALLSQVLADKLPATPFVIG